MKQLLFIICCLIAVIGITLIGYSDTKNAGIKEGMRIEKAAFLAGTSIPTSELSKREANNYSTNYIFYDETFAQVVSIYSDLKEAEVVRLVRYTYPKECKLTLISIKKVDVTNQGLYLPAKNASEDLSFVE